MISVIVAGTNSGVGKTTVTKALLQLLPNPKAFKIGPDFIDPSFHRYVTNKDVHNLDIFCYGEEKTRFIFDKYKEDVNVLEGVMGLFAGLDHSKDNYSTAHTARTLDIPVLLVVDGRSKDTSIQAEVYGYISLDPRVKVKGVLLNNVTSGMYKYLSKALQEIGIKTYGYIPTLDFSVKDRYLGLLQAEEITDLDDRLLHLKEICEKTVDIKGILSDFKHNFQYSGVDYFEGIKGKLHKKVVAYTKDEAFSFMYDTHLKMLEESGAKVITFSPLLDEELPDADVYYFTGGYPELYIEKLQKNQTMIESIKKTKKQIIAECGGYIYLSKGIYVEDVFYDMVGLHNDTIEMTNRLDIKHFGYLDIETIDKDIIRGHEFHYSKLHQTEQREFYYSVRNKNYKTGIKNQNLIAGYPHILWLSNTKYYLRLLGGESYE